MYCCNLRLELAQGLQIFCLAFLGVALADDSGHLRQRNGKSKVNQLTSKYGYGSWRKAGEAGIIYGYMYHGKDIEYRSVIRDSQFTICENIKNPLVNRTHIGHGQYREKNYTLFICPLPGKPKEISFCCGKEKEEYCCGFWEESHRVVSTFFWPVIFLSCFGLAIVIFLLVYFCLAMSWMKKKLRKRFQEIELNLLLLRPGANATEREVPHSTGIEGNT